MTKTNKSFVALCDEKINELKATIAQLKTNETISKATRGTQLYARGRERRVLALIKALIAQLPEDVKLEDEERKTLVLVTTLAAEKQRYDAVVIEEGEMLIDVLKRYEDRGDVMRKIAKACEKAGLVIDYTQGGKFVKA